METSTDDGDFMCLTLDDKLLEAFKTRKKHGYKIMLHFCSAIKCTGN